MMEAGQENSFDDCVEKIEASYEFMLAYAAQGRDKEPSGGGNGPSVRQFVSLLQGAVEHIAGAGKKQIADLELPAKTNVALHSLALQLEQDAGRAKTVIDVVLSAPALSSQLIDNLNASAHLRCLLTTIFVLDEVLQQHARAVAV